MDTNTILQLIFSGTADKKLTIRFPNANAAATAAQVKALMQAIVANAEVYAELPVEMLEANMISTIKTPVSLA